MKVLSSPESPRKRTMRRVSKPLMEKRRRERINHSLETLRLLMLDNTHNEKLKNPKVEKAEILESVVDFLQTETEVEKGHRAVQRVLSGEKRQTCARQATSYHDGMRSCLLRVSHFIASKSQELGETGGDAVQATASSPGHLHRALMPSPPPPGDSAALSPPHLLQHHRISHPYLTQVTGIHGDTRELLSSTHSTDPVWRPWPQ